MVFSVFHGVVKITKNMFYKKKLSTKYCFFLYLC